MPFAMGPFLFPNKKSLYRRRKNVYCQLRRRKKHISFQLQRTHRVYKMYMLSTRNSVQYILLEQRFEFQEDSFVFCHPMYFWTLCYKFFLTCSVLHLKANIWNNSVLMWVLFFSPSPICLIHWESCHVMC